MAGGKIYGGSNMAVILQNQGLPCSAENLEALLISTSSPTFHGLNSGSGSASMVNFGDVNGGKTSDRCIFRTLDQDINGDEDFDEYFHQPEKKRRLTSDQVQFLEKSFEVENKLEPERKIQLAKDLGLQPRQIAIWFQNRRARWKTKQLEKDYEALRNSYNSLKADCENLHKEKEILRTEVLGLTEKLKLKEKEGENLNPSNNEKPTSNSVSEEKLSDGMIFVCKQEDLSPANSDDLKHSSPLEAVDSSHVFEPDQSDLSQDEDDDLGKSLLPPFYHFPKLEDGIYPNPPVNSCNNACPVEDQALWFWSY